MSPRFIVVPAGSQTGYVNCRQLSSTGGQLPTGHHLQRQLAAMNLRRPHFPSPASEALLRPFLVCVSAHYLCAGRAKRETSSPFPRTHAQGEKVPVNEERETSLLATRNTNHSHLLLHSLFLFASSLRLLHTSRLETPGLATFHRTEDSWVSDDMDPNACSTLPLPPMMAQSMNFNLLDTAFSQGIAPDLHFGTAMVLQQSEPAAPSTS